MKERFPVDIDNGLQSICRRFGLFDTFCALMYSKKYNQILIFVNKSKTYTIDNA